MLAAGFKTSVPFTGTKVPWLGVCLTCGQPGKPTYNSVQQRDGACGYCARNALDPTIAEGKLLAKDFMPTVPFPGVMKPWPGYCLRCGQPGKPRYVGNASQGGCSYCAGNAVDAAIAVGRLLAWHFAPTVPFPGAHKAWPGVCHRCGEGGAPRYSAVQQGHDPCKYCSRKVLRPDIAVGKMLARDFLPSTPYVNSNAPWPGVCLKCGYPGRPRYAAVASHLQGACEYCSKRKVDRSIVLGKMLAQDFVPSIPFPGVMVKWPGVCLRCGRHTSPKYNSVQQGNGACEWCAGRVEPDVADARMRARDFAPSTPFQRADASWPGVCLKCEQPGASTFTQLKLGVRPCSYCAGKKDDSAVRLGKMLARDFSPSVPYPGAMTKWPGVCLRCGYPSSPTYQSVKMGNGACGWCGGVRVDAALALGKMLAVDFEPGEPFPGSRVPWKGRCLKCGASGAPRFNAVDFGQGACRECSSAGFHPGRAGYFYAVTNGVMVKGGISNTEAKVNRLETHQRQGLDEVLFVVRFENGVDAQALEELWIDHLAQLPMNLRVRRDQLTDGYTEAALINGSTEAFLRELRWLAEHFAQEVSEAQVGVPRAIRRRITRLLPSHQTQVFAPDWMASS